MYYCPFRKEIKTYAADGETPVPAKYAIIGSRSRDCGCPNCRNVKTMDRCSKVVICLDTGVE